MALGHPGARDIGPRARAAELSCRSPARRRAVRARATQAAIKFNSFWTIECDEGWSLFATHPVNRDDLPFRTVSGLVDADRFHDGGINFPAVWTAPDFSGVLTKGTPVAQCFAVPRETPQLVFEPFDVGPRNSIRENGGGGACRTQRLSQAVSRATGQANHRVSAAARSRRSTAGRAMPRSTPSRSIRTLSGASDRPPHRRASRRRDRRRPATRCRD